MAFKLVRAKYQEPEGAPVNRTMEQLGGTGRNISRIGNMGAKSGRCSGSVGGEQEETLKAWPYIYIIGKFISTLKILALRNHANYAMP